MKFLIWLLIGFAVVTWFSRLKSGGQGGARNSYDPPGKPPRNTATATTVESMQQCVRCGTYIPDSEAVTDMSGKIYCSEEHRSQRGEPRA